MSLDYVRMFGALMQTFTMVGIAVVFAVIFGLPLGYLVYSKRWQEKQQTKILISGLNLIINGVRSFPFLIFVIVLVPFTRFVLGTGFGTKAAALPLSLIAIVLYARLVEQSFLAVNRQTVEAAFSMGATMKQVFKDVLLVEACSSLIISLTSVVISLISYSTVMGVVGGGGLGDFAIIYGYQSNRMDLVWVAVLILMVVVQVIQSFGTYVAKKLER